MEQVPEVELNSGHKIPTPRNGQMIINRMQDIHHQQQQMEQVPEVELNSGHKIPVIGMGTAVSSTRPPPTDLTSIFLDAIEAGCRHFDTASLYGTEEALGRAVAEALDRSLINRREDLFITSKLWCTQAAPELVLPSLKNTLEKLGLEYVDLYLIHWPVRLMRAVHGIDITSKDVSPLDTKNTWEAMEECSRLGLAKSIGVSNFTCTKLTNLLKHAIIPPAVNQVELNPTWQQKKLIEFCKEKGIKVAAYSPLGGNGAPWGTLAVMKNSTLSDIAAAKGKTLAQVSIRWVYEQGAIIIVKSFNKERMKQNLQIFDWKLTKEELALIEKIPQHRSCTGRSFIKPDGVFKSVDDLWDGET